MFIGFLLLAVARQRNSVTCKPSRNSNAWFVMFHRRPLLYTWCLESTDLNGASGLYELDNKRGMTLGGGGGSREPAMFCYNVLQMGSWGHEPHCVAIAPDNFQADDGECLTFQNGGDRLKHCDPSDAPLRVALLRVLQLSSRLRGWEMPWRLSLDFLPSSGTLTRRILAEGTYGHLQHAWTHIWE
jgi:hypothetical protein